MCWGQDLIWDGEAWRSPVPRRTKARDPHQLRLNSYRVLLTRGRDGVCMFVPPEARGVGEALSEAGAVML